MSKSFLAKAIAPCLLFCSLDASAIRLDTVMGEISEQVGEVSKGDNLVKPVSKRIENLVKSKTSSADKSAQITRNLTEFNQGNRFEQQIRSLSKFAPKIIAGQTVAYRQYPWQVALLKNTPPFRQVCGGSLIQPGWVLTAAHCVDGGTNASDILVLSGSDYLDKGGVRLKVVEIIKHENYIDPVTSGFDIALIRLENESDEATISLLTAQEESLLSHTGALGWVTGWGVTETGYPSIQLKEVDVRIIATEACNSSQMYGGVITESMLCAGYRIGGKDSCQGDSGGPLMVVDQRGGLKQVGVVSWGDGCAEENRPGVYTRLAILEDWIASKLDQ